MANRFNEKLVGLLGDPTFNLGIGLLGNSGPSLVPQNFGQVLAGAGHFVNERQQQQMQNQYMREDLLEMQRRRNAGSAVAELTRLIPQEQFGPGQQAFIQALPLVDPDAALKLTGDLLGFGQQRADTSLVRNLIAAGIDPASGQGRDLITANIRGDDVTGQLAQVQANLLQLELDQKKDNLATSRRERETEARTEREQKQGLVSDIGRQIRDLNELADLTDQLEGTFAQTGQFSEFAKTGLGAAAFLGQSAGFDTSKQQELVAQSERYGQLATSAGIDQFATFQGTITDVKFQTLLNNDVSPNKTAAANRKAIADRLQIALDVADKKGIEIPGRDNIETRIEQLRSGGTAAPGVSSGVRFLGFEQ